MAEDGKIPLFTERVRQELHHQRILVLDGPLDDDNGTLIATQLLTLAAEDHLTDVALWINSPGGSVPSMLAIRDVMRLIPCDGRHVAARDNSCSRRAHRANGSRCRTRAS
jgi:ATP-dependent Clp protease protease subunit